MRSGILRHSFPVAVCRVEVTLNQDMRALVPTAEHDPQFVAYYLRRAAWDILGRCSKGGTTVNSIEAPLLDAYPVPVPPIDVQRRIVSRVDDLCVELEDGEAALARARSDLETYRSSLLKAAVTGELTAAWREVNPPHETGEQLLTRILVEREARWASSQTRRRREYRVPLTPADEPRFPMPAGWTWATLDQLGFIENGQTPRGVDGVTHPHGAFPWFKVSSMNTAGNEHAMTHSEWWISESDAKKVGLTIRPKDTIVFPKRGGAIMTNKKRLLGCDGAFDLNVMGYVPAPTHKDFCWIIFQGIDLGSICDGSNVPQINFMDIAAIEVAVPPKSEGIIIGQMVNTMLAEAVATVKCNDVLKSQSSHLRQAILNAAFQGELV